MIILLMSDEIYMRDLLGKLLLILNKLNPIYGRENIYVILTNKSAKLYENTWCR